MPIEQLMSGSEIKSKLQGIKHSDRKPGDTLAEFADYLATYIPDSEISPLGFKNAALMAIADLQRGVHGFTRRPTPTGLTGHPKSIYATLTADVPLLAELVSSPEFADQVRKQLYSL